MRFKEKNPTIHLESFVAPGAQIVGDVRVSKNVSLWYNIVARGDVDYISIGENSNIQDGTVIHGNSGYPTIIGENVTVGHSAILHGCVIGNGSLIGMGAIILTGSVIGEGSIIGAGTVITEGKKIPPNSLVLGSPGKVIRDVTPKEKEGIKKTVENYIIMWKERYTNDEGSE